MWQAWCERIERAGLGRHCHLGRYIERGCTLPQPPHANGAPYPGHRIAEAVNAQVIRLPADLRTAIQVRWLFGGRMKQKAQALGLTFEQYRARLRRAERLVGQRLDRR